MANTFTPTDVYAIVNDMSAEMFGQNNTLTAFDTSTFCTVGEKMLRTGYENTINAMSAVFSRQIVDVTPYEGVFNIIMKRPDEYGLITRKISYYNTKLQPSEDWNTDINGTQLVDGSSVDPWTIHKVYPLEINMAGIKVRQFSYPVFRYQLKQCFASESAFSSFVEGMLIKIANDLKVAVDAENRLQVLNAIGATYNTGAPRQVVNLTSEYNAFYGTSKTTADLLGADFDSLMKFFVMRLKGDMELAKEENDLFHIYPARNDDSGNALTLTRHTTPENRRLIMYMPRMRQAETTVFPSLFDTSALRIENYLGVEYWQNPNVPEAVDIVPNQLNTLNGRSTNGNRVQLDNVFALFFDRRSLVTSVHVEDVLTSPVNNNGSYYVTTYHWAKDYQLDQTHNMILYFLAD